jgi:uncharacterized protein YjbI with pentapeptide repeats
MNRSDLHGGLWVYRSLLDSALRRLRRVEREIRVERHLTGICLMGVYLTGVHLMGVYLMGVYFIGVYLTGVHLIGVYLISVYVIGVYLITCTNQAQRHQARKISCCIAFPMNLVRR